MISQNVTRDVEERALFRLNGGCDICEVYK